ncbi:hypothetical protein [Luteolibacter soli]|uniref:Uncharacterized protein n=1 Tax=Luteolibacter soli TaxID=3135280 RepID=A0ABU9AUZ6_9BACT
MKLPILILIAASVIGLIRHRELTALQSQNEHLLEASSPSSSLPPSRTSRDSASALLSEPPDGLASQVWVSFELCLKSEAAGKLDTSLHELDTTLARLDHHAVAALLRQLLAAHPMDEEQQRSLQYFVAIRHFAIMNPQEAMHLLASSPDSSFLAEHARSVFRLWTIKHPAEAIRWLDSLTGHDRERFATEDITSDATYTQLRFDPTGALNRFLTFEAEGLYDHAEDYDGFGAWVEMTLRGTSEHLAFLTAFAAAESRAPHSRVIGGIRKGYMHYMIGRLGEEWPFEDATDLLDHGFNPAERKDIATQLATHKNLSDPLRWGTWIAAQGVTTKSADPLARFAQEWHTSESPGRTEDAPVPP